MRLTTVIKSGALRAMGLLKSLKKRGIDPQRVLPKRGILWLGLFLLLTALPSWSLTLVERPELSTLKRAEVLRVVNYNTLIVQVVDEPAVRVVSLIGIEPPPPINPTWTEEFGDTPLAVYYTGQYLQDSLNRQEIYLELDPQVVTPEGTLPAYVWQGSTLINQEMLLTGHALLPEAATKLKYGGVLTEATQIAQQQGRGLWTFFGPKPGGSAQPQAQAIRQA